MSAGPTNATEASYLDRDLDRVASGGRWRLGILKHATGVAGTVPYEDGSLPSTLSEIAASGYAPPVLNDSDVSAVSEWNPAVPGNPTVKTGPATGQWSFGTFASAPVSGAEACTCVVIFDRVVRTGVSITTTQGSATVAVAGTTVTNDDLGRRLPTSLGIPAGCVIGSVVDSTHFTISKANSAVLADSANGTTPGTASVTLGEAIRYSLPYFDPAATYPSPPNVTTVNGSEIVTFASALSNGSLYEGATITGPGIPGATTILAVASDGLRALLSAPAGGGAGTDVCTITGRTVAKAFTTNDNPVADPTYPLPIRTGKPKDAF